METIKTTAPQDNQQRKVSSPRYRQAILVIIATITLLNLALNCWLIAHDAQRTVAFDMKGTLDQFMEQSASQALSEIQSQQLVARFSQALDDSLAAYQQEHNVVILVSPSVVLGAPDITRNIQHDIAIKMRESMSLVAPTNLGSTK